MKWHHEHESKKVSNNYGVLPNTACTCVKRMLALHKNLASAKTPHRESIGKASVQQVEPSADGAIDKLVYELYGLTEEEIGIVEGK